MKFFSISGIAGALGVLALGLTGCKKDVQVPGSQTGEFTLHMDNGVSTTNSANVTTFAPLVLNATTYKNGRGEDFTVSTFKYYISNVKLLKADNSSYSVPSSYFLVDHSNAASQDLTMKGVPVDDYTGVSFVVGVDSARTKAGNFTGVLNANNGMYWDMNGPEFINLKLEGRSPQSPTQDTVSLPDYRRIEAKFQLSLRTKIAQDLLIDNADVWLAFTQQAMWQIWNGVDSKPFRNTDYEPEAIYMVPVPKNLRGMPGGLQWRYLQFGLAHQSNGQSDPLSRSWNRVYVGTGFERGNWGLTFRYNHRLEEDVSTDNNPDLLHYRGPGELTLLWSGGAATSSLQWRSSFTNVNRGSLQYEWTYPVFRDQPNGLRWFLQAFSGYGETLTDYNFKQTSVGAGVSFLQF